MVLFFVQEAVLASSAALSVPSAPSSATIDPDSRLPASLPFMVATSIAVQQPAPQASIMPFHNNLFSQAASLVRPMVNIGPQDLGLHNSPAREEGEVPESELDPDTRRRLLILQHGQDTRDNLPNEPPFPVRSPGPVPGPAPGPASVPVPIPGPVPRVQSRGSWFPVEDHASPGPLSRSVAKEYPIAPDAVNFEKQRPPPHPYPRKLENSLRPERSFIERARYPREVNLICFTGILASTLQPTMWYNVLLLGIYSGKSHISD